jgi:hypothetical protein
LYPERDPLIVGLMPSLDHFITGIINPSFIFGKAKAAYMTILRKLKFVM